MTVEEFINKIDEILIDHHTTTTIYIPSLFTESDMRIIKNYVNNHNSLRLKDDNIIILN